MPFLPNLLGKKKTFIFRTIKVDYIKISCEWKDDIIILALTLPLISFIGIAPPARPLLLICPAPPTV